GMITAAPAPAFGAIFFSAAWARIAAAAANVSPNARIFRDFIRVLLFLFLLLLLGRRLRRLDGFQVEHSGAVDQERALRRLVAARRVLVGFARLPQVGPGAQPELGLSFRSLDERAREDHDLVGVGMRVEGSRESRRELDDRAESSLGVIAPEIGDLDSRSAL